MVHSIVFSFWKRSLRLVSHLLSEHGIPSIRVDGDLSPRQRKEALAEFHEKPDARVLLMTLGTGAVGYACCSAKLPCPSLPYLST